MLEESQKVTAAFPNCKARGDDGLPMEVYKQYGECIVPFLLWVLNAARELASLPHSRTKANIILLLKPGKDSTDQYLLSKAISRS